MQREIAYQYDNQARLQSIIDSKDPNNPTAFRYDATGRRTKITIAKPADQPPGLRAVSSSIEAAFDFAGSAANLPDGGSAITLYDEHDRPVEVQTRDVNGAVVNRTTRVYDSEGRIIEEKATTDDPLTMIRAGDQKKILSSGDISQLELRDKLAEFLGGGTEMWLVKYIYDQQGRKAQTTRKVFNHIDDQTKTTYNEHGDVGGEISVHSQAGIDNAEADTTQNFETIFSYQYDGYGNWTVKKTSSRSLPDGTFKDSGDEVRHTIEYF